MLLEFKKLDDAVNLFEKIRKDLTALGQEETYYHDEFRRFSEVYSHTIMYNIPSNVRINFVIEKGVNTLYKLGLI